MATARTKRLVIDASVARAAASEEGTHPRGVRCREFLEAVLTICHRVVLTGDIREEWGKHQARFVRRWRRQMYARKKVDALEADPDPTLLERLHQLDATEAEQEAMAKDWLLIEAALAADHCVVSLDDTVRTLFAKASQKLKSLQTIVWVNPERSEEEPVQWLSRGAEPEAARLLGADA
jgi:hypothetical protein